MTNPDEGWDLNTVRNKDISVSFHFTDLWFLNHFFLLVFQKLQFLENYVCLVSAGESVVFKRYSQWTLGAVVTNNWFCYLVTREAKYHLYFGSFFCPESGLAGSVHSTCWVLAVVWVEWALPDKTNSGGNRGFGEWMELNCYFFLFFCSTSFGRGLNNVCIGWKWVNCYFGKRITSWSSWLIRLTHCRWVGVVTWVSVSITLPDALSSRVSSSSTWTQLGLFLSTRTTFLLFLVSSGFVGGALRLK